MLNFNVRHCKIVYKFHETKSFKQSKWSEKYMHFRRQERNLAKKDFERDFCKFLNKAFYGKTKENVRNLIKIEILLEK